MLLVLTIALGRIAAARLKQVSAVSLKGAAGRRPLRPLRPVLTLLACALAAFALLYLVSETFYLIDGPHSIAGVVASAIATFTLSAAVGGIIAFALFGVFALFE